MKDGKERKLKGTNLFWAYFFINAFVTEKKVPLGTGTGFQVPIPVLVKM